MGGKKIIVRIRKAILIGCALVLAIKGYGNFVSLGVQGGYNIHYIDDEEHGIPDVGVSLGISPSILPLTIVGNSNLNWRTQDQSVNVMSLSWALKYHICMPLIPLRFYLGVGVGGDWNVGEELDSEILDEEFTYNIMGLGGVEIDLFQTQVYIYGDVRYKHLFPQEGSWNQLLIGVGIAYPFF